MPRNIWGGELSRDPEICGKTLSIAENSHLAMAFLYLNEAHSLLVHNKKKCGKIANLIAFKSELTNQKVKFSDVIVNFFTSSYSFCDVTI